jgi:hypothetical protein
MTRTIRCVPWVLALGLVLGASHAQAQVTFQITNGNDALSSLNPGPFATVTLTQSGSNVLVDVKADNITTTGLTTATPASISDFGFNLTGSATVDTTTIKTSGVVMGSGAVPPWGLTTSASFDGFGTFAQDVGGGANTNRVQEVMFTVDNATISSFGPTGANAFAVHWYSNFNPGTTEVQLTGFAAGVPEPSVFACAGTVTLFGLALAWRRRKARTA